MKQMKFRKLYRSAMSGKLDLDELPYLLISDPLTSDQYEKMRDSLELGRILSIVEKERAKQPPTSELVDHVNQIDERFSRTGSDYQRVKDSVREILEREGIPYTYSWEAFVGNVLNVIDDIRKGRTPEGVPLKEPRSEKEWITLIASDYLLNLGSFESRFESGDIKLHFHN